MKQLRLTTKIDRARFMGGGGGGDGGAAAAEASAAKDRARRKAAIDRLMRVFGEGGGTTAIPTKPKAPVKPAAGKPVQPVQGPSELIPRQGGQTIDPMAQYNTDLAQYQRELAAYNAAVKEAAANNTAATRYKTLEDRIARNVTNYQTRDLNEQLDDNQRLLKDELARRGHIGGSQQVDQESELRQLNDDALLDIANLANQARLNFRNDKTRALSNAVSAINADVDSSTAINNALGQTTLAAQQAEETARGQNIGDVFQRMAYLYGIQQQGAGRQAAQQQYNRTFGASNPGAGSSYQGTTVRY